MDEVMTNMNQLAGGGDYQKLFQIQGSGQQTMIALAVAVVIGLIICFFGLKLVRVMSGISGLLIGAAAGVAIGHAAGLSGTAFGAAAIAGAVILAVLAAIFYKVGAFFWVLLAGTMMAAVFLKPDSLIKLGICLGAGLIAAILTVIFIRPLVIIISSLNGGITAGMAAAALLGFGDSLLISCGIALVLAVLGMIVQFMTRSREIGKKEQAYSKEFKEKASRETEVERARMLLEDEDGEDDSDDDIQFIE